MKKLVIQALAIISVFLSVWMGLSKVNWLAVLKVEHFSKTAEEKLGDLFSDLFSQSGKQIQDKKIIVPLHDILLRICMANGMDPAEIKMHVIESDEVNAFALPNRQLIIYTGLISASDNEAELSGVISHELAHIELDHVMKKLVKEVGLSVLISITGRGGGSEIIQEAAKLLSSSAYDRNLEKEADVKAVQYLLNSNINPVPFAKFLSRLGVKDSNIEKHLSWISTHPDSEERAGYVLELAGKKHRSFKPVLSQAAWEEFKESLNKM